MCDIIDVEGIGVVFAGKLKSAGIATDTDLLERGGTRSGRDKIVKESGISGKRILRWVNHVDLFRIKGVQKQYAELLEAAGVDTVPELAQRNPTNLYPLLSRTNEEKKLVRKLPTKDQVVEWITQAKSLPRMVEY